MLTKPTITSLDHAASECRRLVMKKGLGKLWESGVGFPWTVLDPVSTVNFLGESLERVPDSALTSAHDNQS